MMGGPGPIMTILDEYADGRDLRIDELDGLWLPGAR
jgi:hypothetical protein